MLADRSQLDTAIVNVAVNARDAMSGEGQLTIATGPVSAEVRFGTMLNDLLTAMSAAFESGRLWGSIPDGSAVDCPLDHSHLLLHLSWNGFSLERRSPAARSD